MSKNIRFKVVHTEGTSLGGGGIQKILVDTETGVNYLYMQMGYGGGITPLLDQNGKPIITK